MYTTNQPAERIYDLQNAVDVLPETVGAVPDRAMTWRALGEGEGTVRAELREAPKLHPHNVSAMIELAAGSPPAEAEELLRHGAETLAPDYVLSSTRASWGRFEKARHASPASGWNASWSRCPRAGGALRSNGRTWLMDRKPEEALPWLKRAMCEESKLRED
jgi:hypothetical protein